MPLERPLLDWRNFRVIGRNLSAIRTRRSSTIDFLHIPPVMSRELPNQWSVPKLPFLILNYTAYQPENILFAAEEKGGWVN